jgi:hypothetical protein
MESILAPQTVQAEEDRTDMWGMITLVCKSCGGVLVFGRHGWEHRDPYRPCDRILVAWPPASDDLDDEPLAETG